MSSFDSQLSFGNSYSGIGFDATRSIHFDDLKRDQISLRKRTVEVVAKFGELKQRNEALAGKKRMAEQNGSSLWPSQIEEEITLSMDQTEYSQMRQDLIQYIRVWAQEASNQIAMFPGHDPEMRKERAVDFVNLQKKYLRSTTPLGEEEERRGDREEDKDFLKKPMTELPANEKDERSIKDRLRCSRKGSESRERSTRSNQNFPRTSTPSAPEGARNKKDEDVGEGTKSSLGSQYRSEDALGLDGCAMIRQEVNPQHQCLETHTDKDDGNNDFSENG